MPFPDEVQLALIEKLASQLTSSEMMQAVNAAIGGTEATDPEMNRKWRSVSQMCPQSSKPHSQAFSLVRTAEHYKIPMQTLEAVMDAAIGHKHNAEGHIDHCLTELERICTDNGVEITDQMRDGFRGAITSLTAKTQGARPPAPEQGKWTDRTQRQQGGGLPSFG